MEENCPHQEKECLPESHTQMPPWAWLFFSQVSDLEQNSGQEKKQERHEGIIFTLALCYNMP